MDLPGEAGPEQTEPRSPRVASDPRWPMVLVPEPRPWPRSFGWIAECEEGRALCIWYPGEPSDLELGQLRELTPRIEVEMVRGASADAPGGPIDVLLGEQRLPGVLAPARHGWEATLLVPGDHLDDRGDLAVTVRAAGAPAPLELRLQLRPSVPLAAGRAQLQGRIDGLS